MKKTIVVILCVFAIALTLLTASCGKKYTDEINVYNFGEYIEPDTYKNFEKEYNIKVNYSTYDTCESLYSVLKTGGADYDVIITSDYMISRLISEDMLQEIDLGNVPNFGLIGADYKNLEYDPDGKFSVPYMWGTVGIIYNTSLIDDEITSWSSLFDVKYKDQVLMFESTRDAFMIPLSYLGYSLNTTSKDEITEAYELLKQQKQDGIVQGYFQDQMYDKLEAGEAAIGVYYAGDYLGMLENNPDLKFVVPQEGSNFFVDAMCIPATSKKTASAEKFIDYMCSTDVAIMNMDTTGYASPNTEACEEYAEDLDDYEHSIMFPGEDVLSRCEVYTNLPQETLNLYSELWTKLKSE